MTATQQTFRAVTDRGAFIRNSSRTFTHAVLGCYRGQWKALNWCGSLELAQKQVAWYNGTMYGEPCRFEVVTAKAI